VSWKKSEERYRLHFENASDVIYSIDPEMKILSVSPSIERLLGYKPDEVMGKTFGNLHIISSDFLQTASSDMKRVLKGERIDSSEYGFIAKDGTSKFGEVSGTPLMREGKVSAVICIARDITDRKKGEKEREQLLIELKDKNKELEQIFYVASHDLRSPLVNIQGFSKELEQAFNQVRSVLQDKEVPSAVKEKLVFSLEEDIPEALQYILKSVSKMDSLLYGLLRLSRLGRAALDIKKLDMNKLMSDIIGTFEYKIKEKGIPLEIGKLPPCRGDETQINQVFSNLLDNAIKYLDPHRAGVIKISGGKEDGQVVYRVDDNGIGIAEEHQNKIYDIFHRLNPEAGSGEGLGLTIARRIIDRHAGKIWVEAEHGKGSTFFVSFPTI